MMNYLILGIGSRIMTDDAIGLYIVEDLKALIKLSNITLICGETDIDFCLGHISEADFLIIVDAVISGKEPGAVNVLSLDMKTQQGLSMHGLHLLQLIRKRELKGYVIGIEPERIEFGFGLSETIKGCYAKILEQVVSNIIALSPLELEGMI